MGSGGDQPKFDTALGNAHVNFYALDRERTQCLRYQICAYNITNFKTRSHMPADIDPLRQLLANLWAPSGRALQPIDLLIPVYFSSVTTDAVFDPLSPFCSCRPGQI